jgi:hypothetical protein
MTLEKGKPRLLSSVCTTYFAYSDHLRVKLDTPHFMGLFSEAQTTHHLMKDESYCFLGSILWQGGEPRHHCSQSGPGLVPCSLSFNRRCTPPSIQDEKKNIPRAHPAGSEVMGRRHSLALPDIVITRTTHSKHFCGQRRLCLQVPRICGVLVVKDPMALKLILYITCSGIILPAT